MKDEVLTKKGNPCHDPVAKVVYLDNIRFITNLNLW